MKTKPITMTGIVLALASSANAWAVMIYWVVFHNPWEPLGPAIAVVGIASMLAAVLLGSMLVREKRIVGWIAIASGTVCFLIGLLTPQL